MNLVSSRLSALRHIAQVEATLHADHAADTVERSIHATWRDLLAAIRQGGTYADVQHRVAPILYRLLPDARTALHKRFIRLGRWSYNVGVQNLRRTVPSAWMRAALIGRMHGIPRNRPGGGPARFSAAFDHDQWQRRLFAAPARESRRQGEGTASDRWLLEDESFAGIDPGAVGFGFAGGRLSATDRLGRLREPVRDDLNEDEQRDLFARLLFPPPTEGDVLRWLQVTLDGQSWYAALDSSARAARFGPDQLAATIAAEYASGKGQREIASAVLPYVDGVRYRARRVARTFGMAIAQQAQERADEQVDDLTVGWQIRATLDEATRPWHRQRNGEIYYKEPKAGQKGLSQMPHPPMEADDPAERPAKASKMAWN